MRIFDERKSTLVFAELEQGDVFIDTDGDILMKTDGGVLSNAINLDDGHLMAISSAENVVLLTNVKLIIED